MKYLCIVYADHDLEAAESPDSVAVKDACIEQDLAMYEAGKLHMASPLQGPDASVVLKARDGRFTRTDGPFVETKEWIAGFMVIEAKDLDEAIAAVVARARDADMVVGSHGEPECVAVVA